MEKPWKILVPVDFSRYSLETVTFALSLRTLCDPIFTFFHVVATSEDDSPGAFGERFEDPLKQRIDEASEALENLVQKSRHSCPDARITSRVATGIPFKEICLLADEEKFRLIIIGTHGRTGLSHLLIGSTAERVVQLASCPVLSRKPRII